MISQEQILAWKSEYGDIFQVTIADHTFIFRAIEREEYKQIILLDLDLGRFQEFMCDQAVIYPEDYDFSQGLGGIAETLSDFVMDVSGLLLNQANQLLSQFREEMLNFDYQVDCIIHEAFPEYTLDEISTWSIRKTMYYLSRAEWILQTLKGVPLKYLDVATQQQVLQQQAMQQQMPPEPTPPPMPQAQHPYTRPIREELVSGPQPTPTSPPAPMQSQEQGDISSEEAVLAMLAAAGAKVSQPITDLNKERIPELNWFAHHDELTGER